MRLIDADELIKALERTRYNIGSPVELLCDGQISKDIMIIENMPTVEERQKGEWIFKQDSPLIPTGYWQCSECKKGRLLVEENFCPNCGANMARFPALKSSI